MKKRPKYRLIYSVLNFLDKHGMNYSRAIWLFRKLGFKFDIHQQPFIPLVVYKDNKQFVYWRGESVEYTTKIQKEIQKAHPPFTLIGIWR